MLNTNNCIQDEKYSRKRVSIFVVGGVCKFWRGEKKDENTANAPLRYFVMHIMYICVKY